MSQYTGSRSPNASPMRINTLSAHVKGKHQNMKGHVLPISRTPVKQIKFEQQKLNFSKIISSFRMFEGDKILIHLILKKVFTVVLEPSVTSSTHLNQKHKAEMALKIPITLHNDSPK